MLERVDDGEAEPGERDDDDEEDGERRRWCPATGPISERAMSASERAAAPRRRPQDDHVVDGAGEADAADQPDEPGRVAELRGEDGPDERPGAGDRREMVPEQHPARR